MRLTHINLFTSCTTVLALTFGLSPVFAKTAVPMNVVQCGTAKGGMFPSPPMSSLCAPGFVVTVPIAPLGTTQYQWTCGSPPPVPGTLMLPTPAPEVCIANKKYNGQCGSANGVATSSAPSANLCTLGTASTPAQAGASYTWACTGVLPATGATIASCTAPASIVQAVSETVSAAPGSAGSFNVRGNDTAPGGTIYTQAAGSTCNPISITALGVVSYTAPPAGQSCTVNYTLCNSGQCATATLTVNGVEPLKTIGVVVSGLPTGTTLVLKNNGGNNLTVSANGAATFSNGVAGVYAVTVATQPIGANCVVTSSTGNATASVLNIPVACTIGRFALVSKAAGGEYDVTECVKDTVTGLIWEGKTASGARAGNGTYTNYDAVNQTQVWYGGTQITPTLAQVNGTSNSVGYKNMVNSSSLCGGSAWRLPTSVELNALSAALSSSPGLIATWFPNGALSSPLYWTSTPFAGAPVAAWVVSLGSGLTYSERQNPYLVWLVR